MEEFGSGFDTSVSLTLLFGSSSDYIDVLNRYYLDSRSGVGKEAQDEARLYKPQDSTIHIMMYIFPRQFGLHNVFTSAVDTRQTVQPFQDYTLREDEIKQKFSASSPAKVPKRLRGRAIALTEKFQIQHSRCSYKKLLDHYCPVSMEEIGGRTC